MARMLADDSKTPKAPVVNNKKEAEALRVKEKMLSSMFEYSMRDYIEGLKRDDLTLQGYEYVATGEDGIDIVNVHSIRG